MRRILRPQVVPQVLASAALIALLLWRTDIEEAADVAADAEYPYLAIALPLYLLANLLGAIRWRVGLDRMARPPVASLFGVFLASAMVNRVLPWRLGDVLRVQVAAKRYGVPRASVTAMIFVTETLLDGFAFVFLFLFTLAFLGVPQLPLTLVWTLVVTVVVGALVAAMAARLDLDDGWEDRGLFRALPPALRARASGFVPRFLDGLVVLRDASLAAWALAATFSAWLVQAGMYFVFGLTFGLDLSLAQCIVITIAATLVVSVPVVPFNIGTFEVAVAGVLVLMGYERPESVTYALGSHLMTLALAVAAGVPAMWRTGTGLHDLLYTGAANGAEANSRLTLR
jgi:uncharacterized protein (TIRG00374 family)